jgi:NADH-quinone oxidoreductase subunit G/NADP-reducing hydrogenase subunit HndD
MLGAVIKSFWAEREAIAPEDVFSVSIMPCVAKKFEARRPEHGVNGIPDVDAVLTTRELARLVKMYGLDLTSLKPGVADTPFGKRSTAGKIFGATGGVMEAALRSGYFLLTGEELPDLKFKALRGLHGIKQASVEIGGMAVNVAVAHGLGNARKLLDRVVAGELDLHFIEIMACPGGCIGGGGQPFGTDVRSLVVRMKALYDIDKTGKLRVSHKNEWVDRLYEEFLGEPLGEMSHRYLHTRYAGREVLV